MKSDSAGGSRWQLWGVCEVSVCLHKCTCAEANVLLGLENPINIKNTRLLTQQLLF